MKLIGAFLLFCVLAACDVGVPGGLPSAQTQITDERVLRFMRVVETVEPVAEKECRARTRGVNCNFTIFIDNRADQPPNAFQTLDRQGRPIVAFTLSLIADARNEDELAFVLGHETAHHIAGHISRQQQSAAAAAVVFAGMATLGGADEAAVKRAREIGAQFGARRFSKDFELEADALGTIIAARAGYDPVKGAAFFRRIPDPGDRFLGTHPPNAERIEIVRRTAAAM
ncbi:MAG: M48 family metallopeptidase [Pseudomonadota bacterium]